MQNEHQKWIKVPDPGEFRGEGKWRRTKDIGCSVMDWNWIRDTGWLPTHEGEKPDDDE